MICEFVCLLFDCVVFLFVDNWFIIYDLLLNYLLFANKYEVVNCEL